MTAQIGRSIRRLEARAEVTGRAEYAHNLRLPGMLHGKVFRSTVAHGRIRGIDTSAAASLEGVARVVTGEDIQAVMIGVAPVVGTPKIVSSAGKILRALGFEIMAAEAALADDEDAGD